MIEIYKNNVFHLYNDKISYVFYILKNGDLGHLYYGKILETSREEDFDYLMEVKNKAAGTVKFYKNDSEFSLQVAKQEYPVYGTSDFRDSALEIYEGLEPIYLDFSYKNHYITKGKEKIDKMPASRSKEEDGEMLTVVLEDKTHGLILEQYFTIFNNSTVIARSQKLINISENTYRLEKMMSGCLELNSKDFNFVHLSGAWIKERHVKKHNLNQGIVSVGSVIGASSHRQNPFVALESLTSTNGFGEVYGFNLVYSGNFLAQVEVDEWDNSRVLIGINPKHFAWELAPTDSFSTPEALFCYSNEGLNGMSSEFHRFINKHIINNKWLKEPRPVALNNWEATYFDFNEEKLLELAKRGKELGIELFVLDDGWFGKRDTDRTSLGDWVTHEKKFPKGIKHFGDAIHELGLKLGVWFEPEMINEESNLYKAHPEWVVKPKKGRYSYGRGQLVLDFGNPGVVDGIYAQMKKVILETKLDYIKWDMNRNITEAYSSYLYDIGKPQDEFFHRYILGVYELYENITRDFPNVLIEACAGGGGRFDLGMLYYSPQIWTSDDSDGIERLKIQYGTSTGYPLSSMSNHVSVVPNHQVGRITPLDMRNDVAIFGVLGYELDVTKLNNEEKDIIKKQIVYYKKHRDLILKGNFFKLLNPFEGNEAAWCVVSKDKKECLIGFYRILARPNAKVVDYLKLVGLDPKKIYRINESEDLITGSTLMNFGLRLPYEFNGVNDNYSEVKGDYQSKLYYISEKE